MDLRFQEWADRLREEVVGCDLCGDAPGLRPDGSACRCYRRFAFRVVCARARLPREAVLSTLRLTETPIVDPIPFGRMIDGRLCAITVGSHHQTSMHVCMSIMRNLEEFSRIESPDRRWTIEFADVGGTPPRRDVLVTMLPTARSFDLVRFMASIQASCSALVLQLPVTRMEDLFDVDSRESKSWRRGDWDDVEKRKKRIESRVRELLKRFDVSREARTFYVGASIPDDGGWEDGR